MGESWKNPYEKSAIYIGGSLSNESPCITRREFIKDIALVDVSKKYVQTEVK